MSNRFIPNSFQMPNAIVDEFLSKLSGNAFKCYALIARQTTGWHKQSDRISINQFMDKCGIKDRKTAFSCLKELEEILLIKTFKSQGEITEFSLNFEFDDVDFEPVPKNGTSTKNSFEPVPKNGTGGSTKNWHSTKDTIKNTIQNNTPLNPPVGDECVSVQDDELSANFEAFWGAGLSKLNRANAKKAFKRAFELWRKDNRGKGLVEFAEMLIADIRKRNGLNQFGFDKMHPTSYLNGKRWEDEYKHNLRSQESNLDGEWNTEEAWKGVF